MKKGIRFYVIAWLIVFALFNVSCFMISAGAGVKGSGFWTGYVFITLAFAGQLACGIYALNTGDRTKMFYDIPVITVSYGGLIATLICGAVVMLVPQIPVWAGIIACLAILAFTATAVIKAMAVSDIVSETDSRVMEDTMFIRTLTADAEILAANAMDDDIKAVCRKVYEAARYSDPVSDAALADIESQIRSGFTSLADAVAKGADAAAEAEKITALLAERNSKCKSMKQGRK